ncbi:MAG TPA: hypothetical protein VIU65_03225 [Pyrinomonadaceae bacterium]
MPDFAFLNQVLHRACHIFDWHFRIDAVLIQQIDCFDLESSKRSFSHLFDVLGAAVEPGPSRCIFRTRCETKFGGNHYLVADGSECFTHQFFIDERAIDLSCVKECDAAINCRPHQRDHFLFVCGRAVTKAHSHAAEPDDRYLETAVSQFSLLH